MAEAWPRHVFIVSYDMVHCKIFDLRSKTLVDYAPVLEAGRLRQLVHDTGQKPNVYQARRVKGRMNLTRDKNIQGVDRANESTWFCLLVVSL